MTSEILEYLLRATVIWLALLAYYFVAGRKTSFRFQRFFLLGGWLFGLLVPLLPSMAGEAGLPVTGLPTISFAGPVVADVPTVEVAVASGWELVDLLPWLYLLGVLIFAARTLVQGWVTEQYLRTGQRSTFNGYPVVRHQGIRSPFAARGCIFLPANLTDANLTNTALLHEVSHLRARHHYDKTLLTLGSILLWFHPLLWAYRRLLATVHEYEADAAVLLRVPARTYGLQLLHCSLGPARGLGLFSSPLKQRIEMITNKTSRRKLRFLPLLALCLLLAGLVVACSDLGESVATPAEEPEIETIKGPPENSLTDTDRSGGFYANTEDLQASMDAYLKDIYQEIRYPAAARTTGTTGKFRASLSFGTDGGIETINIGSFTDELAGGPPASPEVVIVGYLPEKTSGAEVPDMLVDEIDRVLNVTDKFQPMLKGGKPTRQSMNLDFRFKLEPESVDPVETLNTPEPEELNSEESYPKGYKEGKEAAEKAMEKLVNELAKTVYKRITYPVTARSAGETGKFDFLIDIDETGLITNSRYSKEDSGKNPSGEITVIGIGKTNNAKTGTSDVLVEEVLQTLKGLQLPEPLMIMGVPMPAKLPIRFNFKLED